VAMAELMHALQMGIILIIADVHQAIKKVSDDTMIQ
jgi:hypothetical protein